MKTALALALLLAPRLALADWPACGRVVTQAPTGQVHARVASDGADGAIVVWEDHRSHRVNVFAQHVLASGAIDPQWTPDGVPVLGDSVALESADGGQVVPQVVADGAGGAIVVWEDLRTGANDIDLFAQHLRADGSLDPAWPVNGIAVIAAVGNQEKFVVESDGLGGALVAWQDARGLDVYAQRVLVSGALAWPPDGVPLELTAGIQQSPEIASDGAGGAIVTWFTLGPGSAIFAQHVLATGSVDATWPVGGRVVCDAEGDRAFPVIVPDGAHGAIVAWPDARIENIVHIFVQHVLASGAVDPAWPVNGRAISGATPSETQPHLVPDGAGGAIVNWSGIDLSIQQFAQHVLASGALDPAWSVSGIALGNPTRTQLDAHAVSDGAGGAIITWQDTDDVVARRVRANGQAELLRVLCNQPGQHVDPALIATHGAGAIVAWTDTRFMATGTDIFALQFTEAETVDVPPVVSTLSMAHPVPMPARTSTLLQYVLPQPGRVALSIVDVTGRTVRTLATQDEAAGPHAVTWDLKDDRGAAVRSGVYFARLVAAGRSLGEKVLTIR